MEKSAISFALFMLLSGAMFQGCAQNARRDGETPRQSNERMNIPSNMHLIDPSATSKAKRMNTSASTPQQKPAFVLLRNRLSGTVLLHVTFKQGNKGSRIQGAVCAAPAPAVFVCV